MREIKFRAWDKVNNKMIHSPMAICSGDGGWILFTAEVEGMDCNKAIHPIQQYEITQFTGLTDKHGKDIYEGDVIKADWHWEKPHAVKWPEDYYAYIEYGLSESEQHLEIIGNIYDDPELLKEVQP